jgi:hypothetical protein
MSVKLIILFFFRIFFVQATRWWLVHFIQRFIVDPKRTLTRSRSATDATRFLRHIQARISTAIKCEPVYEESSTNTKRRNSICDRNHLIDYDNEICIRKRSQSVPNHGDCWFVYCFITKRKRKNFSFLISPNQQMLTIKRRSQPIVRSSSVHDLNRHEVFRANELDFGPIIGQGFYGIARTVKKEESCLDKIFVCLFSGYSQENWSDNGDERNKNI